MVSGVSYVEQVLLGGVWMATQKVLSEKGRRDKFLVPGSEEERHVIEEYKRKLAEESIDLSDAIEKQGQWFANHNLTETGEQLDRMGKLFQRRMLMMASMPLMQGISAESFVQTIGMYAGMLAMSPQMRTVVSEKVASAARTGIDLVIRHTEQNSRISAEERDARLEKWNGYRDRLRQVENGGRVPYTPESAAFAQICLDRSAYDAMRRPGADCTSILEEHDRASGQLMSLCEIDGLDRDDVLQAHRSLAGMMAENDPRFENIYWDLSKGKVSRSEPHATRQVISDEFGREHTVSVPVWTGEYELASGEPFEGKFSVRVPMMEGECMKDFSDCVRAQFEACESGADMQRLYSELNIAARILSDPGLSKPGNSDRMNAYIAEAAQKDGWTEREADGLRDIMKISARFMGDYPYDPPEIMQEQACALFSAVADTEFENFCQDHPDVTIEWEDIYDRNHGRVPHTQKRTHVPNARAKEAEMVASDVQYEGMSL